MTRTALASLCSALLVLGASAKDKEPTTRLDVASQPSGALIRVDNKDRGSSPIVLTDLTPGPHLIQAIKTNFRDAFETVVLEQGVCKTVSLSLTPLAGILLVTSTPSGSDVSLKGVSLGSTPLLVTTLEPGTHRLSVSSPGYQTKEIDITLEGRIPVKQDVALMSDSGTLDVSSDPSGAEVLVNGISRGRTPCRVDRIPGGSVTVDIKADGFQPHSQAVSLAAGEVQKIEAALKPLPGTLRIVSIPDGARVYVNDEFRGETPYDLANVQPGSYRVRIEKPGHEPMARDIAVTKGASSTEEFRLTRNTGRLEISTAPAGATVLIDGKKVGITFARRTDTTAVSDPYAIEDVIEGQRQVEIFRKGFAPQRRMVEIKRGETLALQFKLVRQFIPNYEVTTTRSYYKGVLEFQNEEGIRIETAPGVSQTIPMKDVKKHGPLREGE